MSIEISNLYVSFEDNCILENINYNFENKHYLIMGKNGAGKSTLVKAICDMIPFKGSISTSGEVFMIPQKLDYFFFAQTVHKELELCKRQTNKDFSIDKYLREFDLYTVRNSKPLSLSGGQKLRLALLVTVLRNPSTIILDETLVMNDSGNKQLMSNIIKEYTKGITVLEITHDTKRIDECDHLLYIDEKQIKCDAPKSSIYSNEYLSKQLNFNNDLIYKFTSGESFRIECYD